MWLPLKPHIRHEWIRGAAGGPDQLVAFTSCRWLGWIDWNLGIDCFCVMDVRLTTGLCVCACARAVGCVPLGSSCHERVLLVQIFTFSSLGYNEYLTLVSCQLDRCSFKCPNEHQFCCSLTFPPNAGYISFLLRCFLPCPFVLFSFFKIQIMLKFGLLVFCVCPKMVDASTSALY